MKKSSLLAALLVVSSGCNAPVAGEPTQDTAQTSADALSTESGRYLVAFKNGFGPAERAVLANHGASVKKELGFLKAAAVHMPAGRAAALAKHPNVAYVEVDEFRTKLGLSSAQLAPSTANGLYGLVTTRSTDSHAAGFTGTGVKIGVADTGLDYTHPDIAPVYAGGIDTVSNDNDPWWNNDPEETHGTHVAGTIVAANNTQGVLGVAYNARLYHARVLGPTGGYSSDIMDGVRWLVETAGCKIVNMSLGGGRASRTEETFYNSMKSKGALIIAATGNDGATKVSYPAAYTSNIAVGAVDVNNVVASFSNRGSAIDVTAPGVQVLSSVPAGTGVEASVSTAGTGELRAGGFEFSGKTAGITRTLVNCGIGNPGQCPSTVNGNIALIQRGTLSFAEKVTNAMNQGAVAAILYNNVAGDLNGTLGAATTADGRAWIPTVGVSDTVGAKLVGQVGSSATVVNAAAAWDHYDGTSMATPHVAGVVALIWSANPALTNTAVEDALKKSAKDLGAAGYDTTYGFGLVDARAAITRATGK
jgi:subtilisin family serine protease